MKPLRTLVVDDEAAARRLLCSMLQGRDDIEVVGEASDGAEAVEKIRALCPDIVFLDVQMPEMDGFSVIDEVGVASMPRTVFVTAYDRYATRAFDVHAIDYLLKPYDEERLDRAVNRAMATTAGAAGELASRLTELLTHLRSARRYRTRISVKEGDRIRLVDIRTIDWIEAAGKIVRIHVNNGVIDTRISLSALQQRLDPESFVRVHRSIIVNARRVIEIQPWFHGQYVLILQDGKKVISGRSYRAEVGRFIQS